MVDMLTKNIEIINFRTHFMYAFCYEEPLKISEQKLILKVDSEIK